MNGRTQQMANETQESRNEPRGDNSLAATPGIEPEAGRPTGNLPDRRSIPGAAASVPGDDRRTPTNQAPSPVSTANSPLAQMHSLIERSGECPFPADCVRILCEPIDDTLVDIRPDGLIYVSHPHYRDRLDRAFGVGGWALIPLAAPRVDGNRVLYYGFLKARGQYIADAVGGADYWAKNPMDSYDNGVEKAKSDCLVRCCKMLPMFRECWDKDYADYWKSTYAVEVAMTNTRSGRGWKKKGEIARNFDTRPDRAPTSEYHRPPRIQDENQRHINAIATEKPLRLEARDEYVENPENQWDREGQE